MEKDRKPGQNGKDNSSRISNHKNYWNNFDGIKGIGKNKKRLTKPKKSRKLDQ